MGCVEAKHVNRMPQDYQMDIFDFVPRPLKKKQSISKSSKETVIFGDPTEFTVYCGDALERLKELSDKSVNCCITSPPYYGLRDYGTARWEGGDPNCPHFRSDKTSTGHAKMADSGHPVGDAIYKTVCPICGAVRIDSQIGIEETPEEYISKLVDLFREVKRVLRDDGTLWVNIGDSYNGSGGNHKSSHKNDTGFQGKSGERCGGRGNRLNTCKPKDLIGIPWMLAFALRADGWYLRQDIIWAKPNPMPESVKDRCTRSHEYIFLLSKSRKYYFDGEGIKEPSVTYDESIRDRDHTKLNNTPGRTKMGGLKTNKYLKRNKRDVWRVSVSMLKDAHFATFPKSLIAPCVIAGCPKGGVVLDPFSGSGTTGIVSAENGRNYIGIELNPEYVDITKRRVGKECANVAVAVK